MYNVPFRRLARKDGKIIVIARSAAIAKRRGNLAKSLVTRGGRLPRLLARNDGKIVVVARSKASAERRGNLAKSLSDGREGLPRRLARNDGRKIARKDTGGRDCFAGWLAMTENRLARNDGKPTGSQ